MYMYTKHADTLKQVVRVNRCPGHKKCAGGDWCWGEGEGEKGTIQDGLCYSWIFMCVMDPYQPHTKTTKHIHTELYICKTHPMKTHDGITSRLVQCHVYGRSNALQTDPIVTAYS